jgi:hypothetical protein
MVEKRKSCAKYARDYCTSMRYLAYSKRISASYILTFSVLLRIHSPTNPIGGRQRHWSGRLRKKIGEKEILHKSHQKSVVPKAQKMSI